MSEISYIEDVYLKFSNIILRNYFLIDSRDISAINNFYIKITNDEALTDSQGRYILKLLKKYQLTLKKHGLDYTSELENPKWKKEFRILDLSKKVYIETDDSDNPIICLKFPFAFKSVFEKEFLTKNSQKIRYRWDHDQRVNKINVYDINVVELYEFCEKNKFELDNTFLELVSKIEEIWDCQQEIIPHCVEKNGEINLINANNDAIEYWNQQKTQDINKNLFLAKTMGFRLESTSQNYEILHKIASSESTHFWMNDFKKFFDLYKKLDEKIAIILDSTDTVEWIRDFIAVADECNIDRSDIKVCFREDSSIKNNFNQWVKENNLGGKIDSGKIFIFRSKPAKWLFSEDKNVKIVVTNSLFPSMNLTTQRWISSKPCVIFLEKIKPTNARDIEIVKL